MNDFSKGLHSDLTPESQPENTYRYAMNMVDTNSQDIENEKSCEYKFGFVDAGFIPMGSVLMDDGNFVLLNTSIITTTCQIVISNGTKDNYNVILEDVLEFNIQHPIKVIFKRNYKNERIIYWTDNIKPYRYFNLDKPDSVIVYDPVSATNKFDIKKLNIFKKVNTTNNYPTLQSLEVLDTGGNLPVGSYQFVCSFGTNDYSYTNWASFSNPIYVNNKPKTYNVNNYNGAQTGIISTKAIKFLLQDIDPSFAFIKIGVIKTIGGVQTCVKSLDIPLEYLTTTISAIDHYNFQFTYANDTQFETATLAEFTTDYTPVQTGKTLKQFNNRLFLGNYEVSKRDINYQSKANNISTLYAIKEQLLDDLTKDYTNAEIQSFYKSYMSDEVYAMAIVWVYDDLSESYAYHIPGRAYDIAIDSDGAGNEYWINHNTGDNLNRMAYWQSDLVYPDNFNYPSTGSCPTDSQGNTLIGTAIRHHKFPNASKVPFYDEVTKKIRIKGFVFSNITLPDTEFQEGLIGCKIVYADRNLKNNKSVLGQGVHVPLAFSRRNQSATWANYNQLISNVFWGSELKWYKYDGAHTLLDAGSYIDPSTINVDPATTNLGTYHYGWYSPELEFNRNFGNARQAIVEAVSITSDSTNFIKDLEAYKNGYYNATWVNPKDGVGKVSYYFDKHYWLNTLTTTTTNRLIEFKNFIEPNSISYYNDEGDSNQPIPKNSIENTFGTGFLATKFDTTSGGLGRLLAPAKVAKTAGLLTYHPQNITWVSSADQDLLTPTNPGAFTKNLESAVYLTNLVNKNFNQYGPILNTTYNCFTGYYISVRDADGILTAPSGGSSVYGGDTYINKYSFKISSGGGTKYYGDDIDNSGAPAITNDTIQIRLFTQTVLESSVNINFRHSGIDQIPSNSGTALQYKNFNVPDYNYGALYSYLYGFNFSDNSGLYNSDYSTLNQLKTYIHKQTSTPDTNEDITGILYSELQTNTSSIDYYLQFKSNNYTSIPKSSGEITDLFVNKGNLYAHSIDTIWDLNTQPKELNLDDVTAVLGTGSLFSLPPVPINKMQTSEAGLQTLHSTCTSEAGYLFPDIKGTNLNLFNSEGLDEVSKYGMFKFFNQNLEFKFASQYNQIVNTWVLAITWKSGTAYTAGIVRVFNGKFYKCLINTSIEPPTNTAYWDYQNKLVSDYYYDLTDNIQNPIGTGLKICYDDVNKRYIIAKKDFSFNALYLAGIQDTWAIDIRPTITDPNPPHDIITNPDYLKVTGGNYINKTNNTFIITFYSYNNFAAKSFRQEGLLADLFSNECWTISYYPYKKQFSSFYIYQPEYLLFKNNQWFSFKYNIGDDIGYYYEHNIQDSYCLFYDNDNPDFTLYTNDCYIDLVKKTEPISNWYGSISWHSKFRNSNDQEIQDSTAVLSQIIVSNSHQLSKQITLTTSNTKKAKEITTFSDFRDFKDNTVTNENFFVTSALTGVNEFNPLAVNILTHWSKQKRFNDVYLQYRLSYDNANNYKLKLILTDTYENPSIR